MELIKLKMKIKQRWCSNKLINKIGVVCYCGCTKCISNWLICKRTNEQAKRRKRVREMGGPSVEMVIEAGWNWEYPNNNNNNKKEIRTKAQMERKNKKKNELSGWFHQYFECKCIPMPINMSCVYVFLWEWFVWMKCVPFDTFCFIWFWLIDAMSQTIELGLCILLCAILVLSKSKDPTIQHKQHGFFYCTVWNPSFALYEFYCCGFES